MADNSVMMYGIEHSMRADVRHSDMAEKVITHAMQEIGAALKKDGMAHYAFTTGKSASPTYTSFIARLTDETKRLLAGKPPCRRGRSTTEEHTVEEPFLRGMVEWMDAEKSAVRIRIAAYGRRCAY